MIAHIHISIFKLICAEPFFLASLKLPLIEVPIFPAYLTVPMMQTILKHSFVHRIQFLVTN